MSQPKIRRLTNTIGFLLTLDVDHELRFSFDDPKTTGDFKISSPIEEKVHVLIDRMDKEEVELVRDFFSHIIEHMEASGVQN